MPLAAGQPRAEPEHGGKAQGRRVTYVRLYGTRPRPCLLHAGHGITTKGEMQNESRRQSG
jgi:hypothetical protein